MKKHSLQTIPMAAEINDAHQCAQECAGMAVEHAQRCGEMLAKKRKSMSGAHEFEVWLKAHCTFGRSTAYNYMKVSAAKAPGLKYESIRAALGQDNSKPAQNVSPSSERPNPSSALDEKAPNTPRAVPVLNPTADPPEGTGETASEPPAAHSAPAPAAGEPPPVQAEFVERVPDDYVPEADDDFMTRVENVMGADDKLSAMLKELKDTHAQLALMKRSRDHYMTVAGEMTRQVKSLSAKLQRLERARA